MSEEPVVSAAFDLYLDGRTDDGFHDMNFDFSQFGVRFDGKCLARRELPEYAITRIRASQWIPGGHELWQVEFPVPE